MEELPLKECFPRCYDRVNAVFSFLLTNQTLFVVNKGKIIVHLYLFGYQFNPPVPISFSLHCCGNDKNSEIFRSLGRLVLFFSCLFNLLFLKIFRLNLWNMSRIIKRLKKIVKEAIIAAVIKFE